ncbi:MAG: hypothetical protein MJA84_07130 [Firmicutes bacterium]|nr:hypothetical protein [Bacillota bacterium]
MVLEKRVAQLEKEVAELKERASAQPELLVQSGEKLVSVIIRTDKRVFEIEEDNCIMQSTVQKVGADYKVSPEAEKQIKTFLVNEKGEDRGIAETLAMMLKAVVALQGEVKQIKKNLSPAE